MSLISPLRLGQMSLPFIDSSSASERYHDVSQPPAEREEISSPKPTELLPQLSYIVRHGAHPPPNNFNSVPKSSAHQLKQRLHGRSHTLRIHTSIGSRLTTRTKSGLSAQDRSPWIPAIACSSSAGDLSYPNGFLLSTIHPQVSHRSLVCHLALKRQ